ncbi:MAG: hypothetical protein GYB36_12870 [Alphaproteobacteria bacterium]|nr:hypothetical protein [Alphaproteobacteria bacterium]
MPMLIAYGVYTIEYMEDPDDEFPGSIMETWRVGEAIHRESGPAKTWRDIVTGNVLKQEYHQHGKLHRTGAPAVILYDLETGDIAETSFYEWGEKREGAQDAPHPPS